MFAIVKPKKTSLYKICISLFLMMMGCMIYANFRQNTDYRYQVMNNINKVLDFGLNEWIEMPNFVKYNLVDGFWLCSLLLMTSWVFSDFDSNQRKGAALMVFITAITLEAAQLFGFSAGTFDYLDLLTYFITYFLFHFLNFNIYEKSV